MRIIPSVVVWLFRFSSENQDELRSLSGRTLNKQEEERAARFHFERDRSWYCFFHEATRYLLSSVLPGSPEPAGIRFDTAERGKPLLTDFRWEFNLTHSRGIAALAVSNRGPVGIDVEEFDPNFPAMEVAREFFAGEETAFLESAESINERKHRFFQLWTAKESVMKFIGLGMSLPPQKIEMCIDAHSNQRLGIKRVDGYPNAAAQWRLHQFDCEPEASLSLVCLADSAKIDFRDLSNVPPAEWLSRFDDREPPK
jgi:4'-phosphopantetheinyl transferase